MHLNKCTCVKKKQHSHIRGYAVSLNCLSLGARRYVRIVHLAINEIKIVNDGSVGRIYYIPREKSLPVIYLPVGRPAGELILSYCNG